MEVDFGRERYTISLGGLNLHLNPPIVALRSLPLTALPLLYIILSSAYAVWFSPAEEVKAALALPAFVFLPLLAGAPVFRLLPIDAPELDWFGRSLIGWLLGALTLTLLAVLLQLAGMSFFLERYGLIGLSLAVVGFLATNARISRERSPGPSFELPVKGIALAAFAVAIVIATAPKAIATPYTPFPLVMQNFLDPMFYSQPALRMLNHGFMDLENLAHAPAMLTLMAIHSQLYDMQPISLLWMGPFLLHAMLGAGLYLWARELSGRWTTGLLVAGIGVFILTGTVLFQSTPVVMRSNTLIYSLVPMLLYVMHRLVVESKATTRAQVEGLVVLQLSAGLLFLVMNVGRLGFLTNEARVPLLVAAGVLIGSVLVIANRGQRQWSGVVAFFPILVCVMAFHIYEGAVFLTAIIVYGFALAIRNTVWQPPLAFLLAAFAFGLYFTQHFLIIDFPDDFSIASSLVLGGTYNEIPIQFASRLKEIKSILSWEVIALLSLGAAGFFFRPRSGFGRAVVIGSAMLFIAYIMPDARAHRVGRTMAPFLAFLLVAGADHIGWLSRHAVRLLDRDRPVLQEVVKIAVVAAVFAAILVPFLRFYSFIPVEQSTHSKLNSTEYEVINWFRDNTDENIRVISDYRTMQMITAFSDKVSLTERQLYPVEMTDEGRTQMGQIKSSVITGAGASNAWYAIQALRGSEPERERDFLEASGLADEEPTIYVVWTGRTSLWATAPGIGPVRQTTVRDPYYYETANFENEDYFRLVADFDGHAFVYEVLPPADQAVTSQP